MFSVDIPPQDLNGRLIWLWWSPETFRLISVVVFHIDDTQ
jgi:hypothetical protein